MTSLQVEYRPELTPTLRRLFAGRLTEPIEAQEDFLRGRLGLKSPNAVAHRGGHRLASRRRPTPPLEAARRRAWRVRVRLQWQPTVWRVIELRGDHTLQDLHYAIQSAFGWDDDHLYAFYLSGRAWDSLTAIERPYEETDPPTADEVTLIELDPRPKQQFLYIFDFGDELRHEIEVLDAFETRPEAVAPRIVESHGQAPPQYRQWEDDADDDEPEVDELDDADEAAEDDDADVATPA